MFVSSKALLLDVYTFNSVIYSYFIVIYCYRIFVFVSNRVLCLEAILSAMNISLLLFEAPFAWASLFYLSSFHLSMALDFKFTSYKGHIVGTYFLSTLILCCIICIFKSFIFNIHILGLITVLYNFFYVCSSLFLFLPSCALSCVFQKLTFHMHLFITCLSMSFSIVFLGITLNILNHMLLSVYWHKHFTTSK